jgi:uncharacterized protein (UPF0261 family)
MTDSGQVRSVAVIGTLDTKSAEIKYIAHELERQGLSAVVIDSGILGQGTFTPEITRERVAEAAGLTLEEVRAAGSRGAAVEHMQRGLRAIVPALAAEGLIHGAICLGGAEGGLLGAAAMHDLPIGFPKLIVSPSASGRREFGPFMGSTDMLVMHSVIDILGLNPLARSVFDNAAAAMAGMVLFAGRPPEESARTIGITMLGQTTPGAAVMRALLEEEGYEPIVFHANGVGGPAMDALVAQGGLHGVIEFTVSEIANSVKDGIHATGPDRMRAAAEAGVPLLVVPGAADFFNQGPRDSVPVEYAGRAQYFHNPVATLVRMSADEMAEVGRRLASVVDDARGPVRILVPAGGFSLIGVEGGAIHDREADDALVEALRSSLRDPEVLEVVSLDINDPGFGRLAAQRFLELDAHRPAERIPA